MTADIRSVVDGLLSLGDRNLWLPKVRFLNTANLEAETKKLIMQSKSADEAAAKLMQLWFPINERLSDRSKERLHKTIVDLINDGRAPKQPEERKRQPSPKRPEERKRQPSPKARGPPARAAPLPVPPPAPARRMSPETKKPRAPVPPPAPAPARRMSPQAKKPKPPPPPPPKETSSESTSSSESE